ncbi:MAG: hypothetical protein JXA60_12695 [Candidatus Coatesbacteria bacterium]|nr:hypothetical protein [Candidatus Coatesbacteria bacterium]
MAVETFFVGDHPFFYPAALRAKQLGHHVSFYKTKQYKPFGFLNKSLPYPPCYIIGLHEILKIINKTSISVSDLPDFALMRPMVEIYEEDEDPLSWHDILVFSDDNKYNPHFYEYLEEASNAINLWNDLLGFPQGELKKKEKSILRKMSFQSERYELWFDYLKEFLGSEIWTKAAIFLALFSCDTPFYWNNSVGILPALMFSKGAWRFTSNVDDYFTFWKECLATEGIEIKEHSMLNEVNKDRGKYYLSIDEEIKPFHFAFISQDPRFMKVEEELVNLPENASSYAVACFTLKESIDAPFHNLFLSKDFKNKWGSMLMGKDYSISFQAFNYREERIVLVMIPLPALTVDLKERFERERVVRGVKDRLSSVFSEFEGNLVEEDWVFPSELHYQFKIYRGIIERAEFPYLSSPQQEKTRCTFFPPSLYTGCLNLTPLYRILQILETGL